MKKILILAGSPRIHGNSDMLCDQFSNGAKEVGHSVEKINITKQDIRYCTGCGTCMSTGKCILKDDMEMILNKMEEADVIVLATPVYFYNMSAQMKTLIDRTCPKYMKLGNKDYYIIMSAAEDDRAMMKHVLESFQGFFDCLDNPRLAGVVYGLGVHELNAVAHKAIMQETLEAGRNV